MQLQLLLEQGLERQLSKPHDLFAESSQSGFFCTTGMKVLKDPRKGNMETHNQNQCH